MASGRIVAELGRPETPAETAARKAEASRVHRESQTFRGLIAALLATVAVVAVIVFMVPRGSTQQAEPVDVAGIAAQAASAYDHPVVLVPTVPDGWRANAASMSDGRTPTWTVVYATGGASGFLRISQGFGADDRWTATLLSGAAADGTVHIDGVDWTRYRLTDAGRAGNLSYAIGTTAGTDRILVYGATDAATAARAASGLTDQIHALRKDAR